jgi:hypothetical protein
LLVLWVVYVATQLALGPDFFGWLNPKRDPYLAAQAPAIQLAAAAVLAIAAGAGIFLIFRFRLDWQRLSRRVAAVVVLASFLLFAISAYRIEFGPIRVPRFPPKYPGKLFYVPEVVGTWDDYETIPGFDEPKRRLRGFMIREGILEETEAPPPRSDRDEAESEFLSEPFGEPGPSN